MSSIVSPKKTPAPIVPEPVPTPTVDNARQKQQEQDQLDRRRGRASTVVTGPKGDTTTPKLGAAAALGY